MSTILKAENISKQYRLGMVGTGTLSHDLNRMWASIRGKEDPYLKVGGVNDRSAKATEDYVWALRDINFEVNTGEVLGIIGKNGAGKTTLLKILSRVTSPTTGSIKTRGRIASLLEVGTGFHGELSGRENIFMNGAVLGMTKREIKRNLDEIIDFSGCEMYIDTPVKRYSSGMTVRLGFAVAAHLEPEILVVDEVLAVGDAEFQKKAIGKMQDLSIGQGRTVLFVSHNMVSVQNLCTRGIVLENGNLTFEGDTRKAIDNYLKKTDLVEKKEIVFTNVEKLGIISAKINGGASSAVISGSQLKIEVCVNNMVREKVDLHLGIYDEMGEKLLHLSNLYDHSYKIKRLDQMSFVCIIDALPLNSGQYYLNISLHKDNSRFQRIKQALSFSVIAADIYGTGRIPDRKESKFLIKQNWGME